MREMPHEETFEHFCRICEQISREKSKRRRAEIVANYLGSLSPETGKIVTRFLLGHSLPKGRTLNVGGSTLVQAAKAAALPSMESLKEAFTTSTDFGESIYKIICSRKGEKTSPDLRIVDIEKFFRLLEAEGGKGSSQRKMSILFDLLSRLSPLEVKWLAKIIVSEMRHGVNIGILIDAIAILTGEQRSKVETASMLLGELEDLAYGILKNGKSFVAGIAPTLFKPLRPMLAEQVQTIEEALERMGGKVHAEIKLDGLRAQVHKKDREVRIFSRSLRDLTPHLGEVAKICSQAISAREAIIDGEIIAVNTNGNPLPFQKLSKRITAEALPLGFGEEFELRPYLFDILLVDGLPTYSLPLSRRHRMLEGVVAKDVIVSFLKNPTLPELREFFKMALSKGHEGLMIKDTQSPYRPGTRGKHWLKLKRKITLDLVIIAAEYGYGRRHGWLSNYLLAVRDTKTGRFLPVGKTFKGLSDAEFERMTARLKSLKTRESEGVVIVKPEIVVEVSFGEVQRSRRYESGYALRFARIDRIREEKTPEEVDTLDRLACIFASQGRREI